MKRSFKLLSLVMTLCLIAGLFTVPVWAAETGTAEAQAEITAVDAQADTAAGTTNAANVPAENPAAEVQTDAAAETGTADVPAEATGEGETKDETTGVSDENTADEEVPTRDIAVSLRVESGLAGEEKTLISNTTVLLTENMLMSSIQATPYEALMLAAKGEVEITESDLGSFVTGIMGVSDETNEYSWMYAVNNELPEAGIDSYPLKDGDEVVFYFTSWEDADYSYFTPGKLTVGEGESFSINLTAVDFSDGEYPMEDAQLIITSDAPTTRELNYTDAEGNVELSFFAPGKYEISAAKENEDGVQVISRPYCVVTVESAEIGEADDITSDSGITPEAEAVAPEASIPAEENGGTVTAPGGFDLNNIQPMPMPTAKISYDAAANNLTVFDKSIDINSLGLQVIYDGEELYLPLRAVAEAMGATVDWNSETSSVSVLISSEPTVTQTQTSDGGTATASASASASVLNAAEALAANEIKFVDNHIYVPSVFIIELFGGE